MCIRSGVVCALVIWLVVAGAVYVDTSFFFFQAEDGIRDVAVTGVQTCALPIYPVQTMLMAGDIDMGHARALLSLDRAAQITAGNQIAAKKLSVREAEALVKKIGADFSLVRQKSKKDGKSRDIKRVEEELSDLLMADVEVRIKKSVRRGGKLQEMGEVAIQFGSL